MVIITPFLKYSAKHFIPKFTTFRTSRFKIQDFFQKHNGLFGSGPGNLNLTVFEDFIMLPEVFPSVQTPFSITPDPYLDIFSIFGENTFLMLRWSIFA